MFGRSYVSRAMVGVCLFAGLVMQAETPGGSRPVYPQLVCVVPMIGAGTLDDPRRPLFAPASATQDDGSSVPASKGFSGLAAITSFRSVPSDDGLFAIVLFEARDRAAFKALQSDRRVLQRFDLATTPLETLLPALKGVKRNFDLSMLRGGSL